MRQAIAAIEQEMKYINESENGAEQYRKGYVRALEIVAEFLNLHESGRALYRTNCPGVDRLLSFASPPAREVSSCGAYRQFRLAETLTVSEKEALEIALGVLRSNTDYGDFLTSWLRSYGAQILSGDPPSPLLPPSDAELDLLEAELRRFEHHCHPGGNRQENVNSTKAPELPMAATHASAGEICQLSIITSGKIVYMPKPRCDDSRQP
jgi:hypothetical protein